MKRKIAAALSIIMVTASYAAPFVQAADPVEVTGDAATAYVDASALNVVVPTSAALDFTLDPQGLVSLGEDKTKSSATQAELKDYSGRILGNNALIFANKSLKPVTVTTKFKVETTADVVSPGKGTLAEAKSEDDSNKANLIFMAVPNATAINVAYSDKEKEAGNKDLAKLSEYSLSEHKDVWASKGVLFGKSSNEKTIKSRVAAADFKFIENSDGSFSYELNDSKQNSAAGFVIAGFCNPYYKDYATLKDVKVTASYSFAASSKTEKQAAVATGTFAVIDAVATLDGTPSNKGVVTSVGSSSVATATVSGSIASGLTITAPAGKTFDATTFQVYYNNAFTSPLTWSGGKAPTLNSDKNVWTLSTALTSAIQANNGKYEFKVKYTGDADMTTVTFTPAS